MRALDPTALHRLIRSALDEDLGSGDVTAEATIPAGARARAVIRQKAAGVVFGLEVAEQTFLTLDPSARITRRVADGDFRADGGPVLEVVGDTRALLAAERTALNFLGRLSGIATLTHAYVEAVAGTGVRILDTRKTTPGLRRLEKAAVAAGGGVNHRVGLYDEFLIKENHAAAAGGVGAAVRAAAGHRPGLTLVVEAETLDEVAEALAAWADAGAAGHAPAGTRFRILLDNMTPAQLRAAVDLIGDRAETEASGGVSLAGLREVADTGVDFVSVGALTHSAPVLDLSLRLEPLP